VPAEFLEAQGIHPWQDMPVWIPAAGEMAGAGTVSNARAVAKGLRFRPVDDTARATLEWYRTLDADRQKKVSGAGLVPEREAKALAAWHAGKGKKGKPAKPAAKK
jgi:2'-hydroxyisoflavone reductase